MKQEKKLKPRKATRENAIKCAQNALDASKLPGRNGDNGGFSVKWYEESWLYGGKGGEPILEALVEEGVLVKVWKNYRLKEY